MVLYVKFFFGTSVIVCILSTVKATVHAQHTNMIFQHQCAVYMCIDKKTIPHKRTIATSSHTAATTTTTSSKYASTTNTTSYSNPNTAGLPSSKATAGSHPVEKRPSTELCMYRSHSVKNVMTYSLAPLNCKQLKYLLSGTRFVHPIR